MDNIQCKAFLVEEHGFRYKGEFHEFNEIAHLFFNHYRGDKGEGAVLEVFLDSGKKFEVSIMAPADIIGAMMLGAVGVDMAVSNLVKIHDILASKSFQKRLQKHISDIERKGYFSFDKCQFFPAQRKITFLDKEFYIDSSILVKEQCYVELRKKDYGFLDMLKRETPFTKIPQFDLRTDRDIIYHLLEKYFDLRYW